MQQNIQPYKKIKILQADIRKAVQPDGSIRLANNKVLKKCPRRITDRLLFWASKTPDRVFLAQKLDGKEDLTFLKKLPTLPKWSGVTYLETLSAVRALGQFLLQSDVSPEKPLIILSENSVEHGLMALAALHVGLPYSAIAPAYSLRSTDFEKLRHIFETLTPGLVFVQNGKVFERATGFIERWPQNEMDGAILNRPVIKGNVQIIAAQDALPGQLVFEDILKTTPTPAVEKAFKATKPETIAKILFTSGSTGLPKGVINTHGNVTTNWQQITQTFPFFQNGGLALVDWLPWNHTFGGNHNFGLTLFNGGSLYIDGGNPTPHGIETTLENLRDIAPTVYFNVPKGFEELLPRLRADKALCRHFFSRLNMFFYAGAGMAQHVWDDLEKLSVEATGKRLFIGSGLGMTEASPSCLFNTQTGNIPALVGTPVPGLEVKLWPDGGKWEARFKGKNITPGYWRNPEASEKAFDEEGFYRTGDALKFLNPDDPNAGLVFDGRIAEDFKLDTGTWVSVGVLRAKLIAAGKGLIQDAVITGHDRPFLGAIVFPDLNFCKNIAGMDAAADLKTILSAPAVKAALATVLEDMATQSTGSSTLIKKAVFADFHLSMDKGEITDKGSINQRQVLANRAEVVARIYEAFCQ